MRAEIAALHRRLGNTMIYVSHDQVEAMTLADKIVVLWAGVIEQAGTPLELYNTPRNQFVAGFIGSPRMNFVDAVVTATSAEGVSLKDAEGNAYQAGIDVEGLSAGDAMVVGIRPDHLEIGAAAGCQVTVQAVEQLGGESYLYCETQGGTRLTAHLPGQTSMRRGERTSAVFHPRLTHLFRKDDGLALKRLVVGEAVQA
jgi:multiple sugar transport system ATP-binding protein